ncbi:MAG: ABC transporter substrate-binding protein [Bacteroidota bacterium]|nr:ABC transporter substrate-binding protein [Bacteroidota bacterium]
MKNRSFHYTIAAGMFLFLLAACSTPTIEDPVVGAAQLTAPEADTQKLRKLSFLPYWVENAQFAGYYVAKEKGIYRKYGLDVEIIPFDPYRTSDQLIRNGEADFAAIWLVNAIEAKAAGTDIVNIAQLSTRSSLMLISKKSSGIDSLQDMNHKKAGIWKGFELPPTTLFKKYGLDVEIITIGSTNNLFLNDGVDITNASWFDEYHSIINAGFNTDELNTFFFADYGLNFLEDGIYCLSKLRKNEPSLCTAFVKATAEGWDRVFHNPEESLDLVMEYVQRANLPVDRTHQRWMLNRYRDLYYSKGHITTYLKEADYLFAAEVLKEHDLIREIPAFHDFYLPYDSAISR